MVFLGVDPGLNKTGVGIIAAESSDRLTYISHKLITTNTKLSLPDRLGQLVSGLKEEIIKHKVDCAAIENVFLSPNTNNAKSALLLGQARGALIAALIAHDIPVEEFTALQIKQAVTGFGKADKLQVRKLVELQLKISFSKNIPLDVSDALGCAICLAINKNKNI